MIRQLRPILALFARAVRDDVRAKFPPIMRTLAVLFVLLVIWGNQRRLDMPDAGLTVLNYIAIVNLVAATLFSLGSFSSAITEEKEDETMSLLRMTRLNPVAILLGKGTARLAGGLLFVVVQIPFMLVCIALGGVSIAQVLKVYAVLAAYLVFLSSLCLFWSVICRRSARAVSLAFASFALLYLLPFFLAINSRSIVRQIGWYDQLIWYLCGVNPYVHTLRLLQTRAGLLPIVDSIWFHLIGAAVLFAGCWALFDRFCSASGESGPARRKVPGTVPRRRRSRTWGLAIAWKEFQFLSGGLRGFLLRVLSYACISVAVVAYVWNQSRDRDLLVAGSVLKWCGLVIFTIELGAQAARIFGNERQQLTLGGLMGLPTGTAGLIGQKILGCVPAFIPSVALWWLGSAIYEHESYQRYVRWSRSDLHIVRGMSASQVANLVLCLAEYALFPILIAFLSLRLRRGALLAGFGIMLFGNILAFMLRDLLVDRYDYSGRANYHFYYALAIVSATAAALLAARIPGQLATRAAETEPLACAPSSPFSFVRCARIPGPSCRPFCARR